MRRPTSQKSPYPHPHIHPGLSPGASERGRPPVHHSAPSPSSTPSPCSCPIAWSSLFPGFCPSPPQTHSHHHHHHHRRLLPLSRACGGLLPVHRGCTWALALVAAALSLSLTLALWLVLFPGPQELPLIRSAAEAEALRTAQALARAGAGPRIPRTGGRAGVESGERVTRGFGASTGTGAVRGEGSEAGAGARTNSGAGGGEGGRKGREYGGAGKARLWHWGWGPSRASLAHEQHVRQANSRLALILERDTATQGTGALTVTQNDGVGTAARGTGALAVTQDTRVESVARGRGLDTVTGHTTEVSSEKGTGAASLTEGTAAGTVTRGAGVGTLTLAGEVDTVTRATEVDAVTQGSAGSQATGTGATQGGPVSQGRGASNAQGEGGTSRGAAQGETAARGGAGGLGASRYGTPSTTRTTPTPTSSTTPTSTSVSRASEIIPGAVWRDEDGEVIQAHGGGMLFVAERGRYYWYGENKAGETYRLSRKHWARVDFVGISCYSSSDLASWRSHGIVLPANESHPSHDLHPSKVVERPKVLYNARTGKYVMWMHVDDAQYKLASTGVAIASAPEGPFTYLRRLRPHGQDSRDMTVYQDEAPDGSPGMPGRAAPAYLLYSSESNAVMHISRLSEDYLDVSGSFVRRLSHQWREAPAVFKWGGNYFMVTSGCTGWRANAAVVHTSSSMMGKWISLGDPCVGGPPGFSKTTFQAQSTFVMPLQRRAASAALRARFLTQGSIDPTVHNVHGSISEPNNSSSTSTSSSGSGKRRGGTGGSGVSAGTRGVEEGTPVVHHGRTIMAEAGAERVDPRASLFLFMADRWNELDLQDSRYVWLPLIVEPAPPAQPGQVGQGGKNGSASAVQGGPPLPPRVQIVWQERWTVPLSWL